MTNKYIKITNKTGFVSRINLEKLGLSSKRNDPTTIGQFGSGIKFAPIAAIRNGWEWWFTGEDSNGKYKMKYDVETEDGVQCVIYNYGDYTKPSSFTLDAGVLSWVDAFQIYREAIANALDEAGGDRSKWYVEIVDSSEIISNDGEFSVFITASPEIIDVHNNFNKYFSINRKVLATSKDVNILEKIDNKLRVYCHNVLVFQADEYTSAYDYNINNLTLNEERTVSSLFDVEWKVTDAILALNDCDLVTNIIKSDSLAVVPFELARLSTSVLKWTTPNISWFKSFNSLHGENCVIYTPEAAIHGVGDHIKLRGYNPIIISNNNLYDILSAAGIKNYIEILGEQVNLEIDYSYKSYTNLSRAIDIVSQYIPELKEVALSERLGVFTSDMEKNLGITLNMDKEKSARIIGINSIHLNDTIEDIVATLIHEFDHLNSGLKDNDYRHFRDLADRRIANLMIKSYKENIAKVSNGLIKFTPDKCSYFDGPMVCIASKIDDTHAIVKIGNKYFIINGDSCIDSDIKVVISSCGTFMYVQGISLVTFIKEINV